MTVPSQEAADPEEAVAVPRQAPRAASPTFVSNLWVARASWALELGLELELELGLEARELLRELLARELELLAPRALPQPLSCGV